MSQVAAISHPMMSHRPHPRRGAGAALATLVKLVIWHCRRELAAGWASYEEFATELTDGIVVGRVRPHAVTSRQPPIIHIAVIARVAIYSAMTTDRTDIEALLPLPPATFHILLALVDQERHGYAIIQDVEERTGGELRMSAGTLYRSVARMVEQGLIAEVLKRPTARLDDERRRYYRITPFGTAVARAEMARLSQLVRLARARGLTPETA